MAKDIENIFQQDGYTCIVAAKTLGLIAEKFSKRSLSRRWEEKWPATSWE